MPEQKNAKVAEIDSTSSAPDRRGAERFPCDLQPSWRILGRQTGESWGAQVNDISATGISLRVRCWIKPGTVIVVRLHGGGDRFSRPLPMRVMHSTQRGDGEWLVGGIFVRPLNDDELRQLIETRP
jgi:hypothetical protein